MSEAFIEQGEKLIKRINKDLKSFELFNVDALWSELDLGEVLITKADKWIKFSIEKGIEAAEEITGITITVDLAGSRVIKDARTDILNKLKSMTNKTSVENLRKLITGSFESNDTVTELTRKIKDEFEQYSDYRAERIARTESSNAYGRGSLEYYRETGIKYKRWQTMEDDLVAPECWDNQNQGDISIDMPFSSGVFNEPNHPNCRCSVIPVSGE